jgi:hypothetical protein
MARIMSVMVAVTNETIRSPRHIGSDREERAPNSIPTFYR